MNAVQKLRIRFFDIKRSIRSMPELENNTTTYRERCFDCYRRAPTVHYTWKSRCESCAATFNSYNRAVFNLIARQAELSKDAHEAERDRDGRCPDDGEVCTECCEHEFDSAEGGYCINGCESHWSD